MEEVKNFNYLGIRFQENDNDIQKRELRKASIILDYMGNWEKKVFRNRFQNENLSIQYVGNRNISIGVKLWSFKKKAEMEKMQL